MKNVIILISTILSFHSFSQGSTYYVSIKRMICASAGTDNVELYVTNPSGSTSLVPVSNIFTNTSQFGTDVNNVFNSIYSQGYQLVPVQITGNSTQLNGCTISVANYLFGKNWTLTSQELDSANSTQLSILNLYPNPTNGLVQVEYENKLFHKPTNLIVYDSKGIVLINETIVLNSSSISVDISMLNEGEYFVVLFNKKEFCEAKKVIKQ